MSCPVKRDDLDNREVYGEGKGEEIIGDLISDTDIETRLDLFIATKCESSPYFLALPGVVKHTGGRRKSVN